MHVIFFSLFLSFAFKKWSSLSDHILFSPLVFLCVQLMAPEVQ